MSLKRKNIIIIIAIIVSTTIVGLAIEKIINEKDYNSNIMQEELNEEEINANESQDNDKENYNGEHDGNFDYDIEETENVIKNGNNNSGDNNSTNKIYIYITGEVNNQGVVSLNKGSRVKDAIDTAGGITEKANITKLNLAYVLEDGMKINIPNDNDLKENPDFKYIINGSDDGNDEVINENGDSSNESKTVTSSSSSKKSRTVNINTASQTELETLPGIGPSIALKIINYRKENGKFSSIEDIKNVSGIGENKFNELKKYIGV